MKVKPVHKSMHIYIYIYAYIYIYICIYIYIYVHRERERARERYAYNEGAPNMGPPKSPYERGNGNSNH